MPLHNDMRYQHFQDWLVKKNNVMRLYKYIYNDSHGDKGNNKAARRNGLGHATL